MMKLRCARPIILTLTTFVVFTIGTSLGPVEAEGSYHLNLPCYQFHSEPCRCNVDTFSSLPDELGMLYQAARSGDAAVIDRLMREGFGIKDYEATCWNLGRGFICNRTPLHYAVEAGHLDAARVLLEAGVDADAEFHAVEKFVSHAVSESPPNNERLNLGAIAGCIKEISTPLSHATRIGNVDAVRLLLKHGANVNGRDGMGRTPLHWAIQGSLISVIEALLQAGADLNMPNSAGQTPAHYANDPKVIEVINSFCRNSDRC